MLSMRLLSRGNVQQYAAAVQRMHTSIVLSDSSSSSSSDSDKKGSKKKSAKAKRVVSEEEKLKSRHDTNERLNSLLGNMITKPKPTKPIDLEVARKRPKPEKKVKEQPYENKLVEAAKDVANSLGGDVKKTESELLNKLLAIESDRSVGQEQEKPKSASLNMKDFITGMTIDRTPEERKVPGYTTQKMEHGSMHRSARVQALAKQFQSIEAKTSKSRRTEGTRRYDGPTEAANVYKGEPLNIFDVTEKSGDAVDPPRLTTWETLQKKEFKLALTHPPENIFEEMIMWTEQGKLWKFPIDNEQGLEEEQSIHFSEHVFMERHLKDWCPKRGPIRHFMQLVCVGLSKNPYMTVREKQEHIMWYRDYFGSKQELLKELGAIETEIPRAKEIAA